MVDVPGSSVAHSSVPSDASAARSFDVGKQGDLLALLNFIRRGPFEQEEKRMLRDAVLDYTVDQKQEILTVISTAVSGKGAILTKSGLPLTTEKQVAESAKPTSNGVPSNATPAPSTHTQVGRMRPQPAFGGVQTAPSHVKSPTEQPISAANEADVKTPVPEVAESPAAEVSIQSELKKEPSTEKPVPAETKVEKETAEHSTPALSQIPDVSTPDYSAPIEEVTKEASKENKSDATPNGLFGDAPVSPATPQIAAEPKTETVEPTANEAGSENTTASSSVPPDATDTNAVHATPAADVASAPSAAPQGNALERIKEIKRLVNEKVGNPVNLIDANNTVGREYMNALLNAMRVVNGGSSEDVSLAMDRLEKAYQSVETTINSGETVIGAPSKPAEPAAEQPKHEMPKEAVVAPTDGPSAIPSSAPNEPTLAAPAVTPTPAASELPDFPERETTSQTLSSEAQTDVSPMPEAVADTPVPVPQPAGTPASLADKLRTEQASRDSLIAQRSRELELDQVKENATDPLQSNAVSAGLQQLLGEWKLFKSSGLFGTGPSGYEHPLYKKLSAMPMSAVIAGRFDGGTPEIKQSIADYMNGWRYEQGVVHEMNETFEHYLRRVIKAILDKQKAPKA